MVELVKASHELIVVQSRLQQRVLFNLLLLHLTQFVVVNLLDNFDMRKFAFERDDRVSVELLRADLDAGKLDSIPREVDCIRLNTDWQYSYSNIVA